MKKQIVILFERGSCGSFLLGLFAKYFDTESQAQICPEQGHCHDQGAGHWRMTDIVGQCSEYEPTDKLIYATHDLDMAKIRQHASTIVLINYTDDDVYLISRFRTMKAHTHNTQWTREEYDRLAGPDWPPYAEDNIQTSPLIQQELIEFQEVHTRNWIATVDRSQCDHQIEFKTIMGFNDGDLNQQVAGILQVPVRPELQGFIDAYRETNYRIYGLTAKTDL